MALQRLPLNVLYFSALVYLSHECNEVDLKHRVMICQKIREYSLQLIVDGQSTDKNNEICCSGYQFMDCVMEVVDGNCTDAARDFISPEVLFINNTFCLKYPRDSCVEHQCREKEYKAAEHSCKDQYNDKTIHILEDPTIHNKSAALCCALAIKGRCQINAMVDKGCEGHMLDLKQAEGLTETYGHCDIYNYLDCNKAATPLSLWNAIYYVTGVLLFFSV